MNRAFWLIQTYGVRGLFYLSRERRTLLINRRALRQWRNFNMGPYCKFCNQRCFVPLPKHTPVEALRALGTVSIMATCQTGQGHDLSATGWNLKSVHAAIAARPFLVTHYDESKSYHETLKAAIDEAARRLEPWREGRDRVVQQDFTEAEIAEAGLYVFVANEYGEETDAGSYIELVYP